MRITTKSRERRRSKLSQFFPLGGSDPSGAPLWYLRQMSLINIHVTGSTLLYILGLDLIACKWLHIWVASIKIEKGHS